MFSLRDPISQFKKKLSETESPVINIINNCNHETNRIIDLAKKSLSGAIMNGRKTSFFA